MTIEAMPIGVRCNLACSYCYQDPVRSGERGLPAYSVERMKGTLEAFWREGGRSRNQAAYIVFGGEPLLVPVADFEEFLKHSFELSGHSGVQTNGSLLTSAHLALFKKYNSHVGISLDGPEELNDSRPAASEEATRETTAKSNAAVRTLLAEGISCSLIVTLHKHNASRERLPRLLQWFAELGKLGLSDAKLHVMEVDGAAAAALRLADQEAIEALLTLHQAEPMLGIRFVMFEHMLDLLRGTDGSVDCVWNGCDPGTTSAVQAVGPQGERLNCARTYKSTTSWLKGSEKNHMRQLALYETPFEDGGCKDCRFFVACKGQCPGEAIDGDSRNRSANCRIWFTLFEYLEKRLLETRVVPVSLDPARDSLERIMLGEWAEGRTVTIERAKQMLAGHYSGLKLREDIHHDHSRHTADCFEQQGNYHGDAHGDHTDATRVRIAR